MEREIATCVCGQFAYLRATLSLKTDIMAVKGVQLTLVDYCTVQPGRHTSQILCLYLALGKWTRMFQRKTRIDREGASQESL